MDKKAWMEKLAREAYEKGSFNGAWLYAENGRIVSKGAYGWRDAENRLPMREDIYSSHFGVGSNNSIECH